MKHILKTLVVSNIDYLKKKYIWKNILSMDIFNSINWKQASFILYLFATTFLLIGCEENLRSEVEKSFFVNQSSIEMFVGDEYQLTASPFDGTYDYLWRSENPDVAVVNEYGLVTAKGEGNTYIVIEADGLTNRIEIVSMFKIPLESVSLSETELDLFYNDKVMININYFPENYNYSSGIVWYSENPEVATVINGEVTVTGEGVTNIVFKSGDITEKVLIDGRYTRPFKGPHILSAAATYELKAANFDFGGEGFAFHDNEPENRRGNDDYRRLNGDLKGTPVEIEGDGANIGYTAPGEWLVYTIEVKDAGDYLIESQVAGTGIGGFHIEVNNVNVTGTINTPNTGGWGNYTWISTPEEILTISFTEGNHRIKYYFEGGHNFRSLRFTKQ